MFRLIYFLSEKTPSAKIKYRMLTCAHAYRYTPPPKYDSRSSNVFQCVNYMQKYIPKVNFIQWDDDACLYNINNHMTQLGKNRCTNWVRLSWSIDDNCVTIRQIAITRKLFSMIKDILTCQYNVIIHVMHFRFLLAWTSLFFSDSFKDCNLATW